MPEKVIGKVCWEINRTAVIWQFFKANPRPLSCRVLAGHDMGRIVSTEKKKKLGRTMGAGR